MEMINYRLLFSLIDELSRFSLLELPVTGLGNCSEDDLIIAFTSAIFMTGRNLAKPRKSVKNKPNEKIKSLISNRVGWNMAQLEGRKSRCSDVAIITNRSNHIPIFTITHRTNVHAILLRIVFDQKSWGVMTLQVIITQ